jgi:hypothetical protein
VADERLRALERAAQDDPSRSAELLVARMRRGDLTRERVELAAYCGHEAARLVVDPDHRVGTYFHLPPTADRPHGIHGDGVPLRDTVSDLARWGASVLVRASVAAARAAYARWALGAHAYRAFHAIRAAEEWLACPCDGHRSLCDGENNGGVAADAPWAGAMLMAVLVAAMPPTGDHVGHVRSYVLDTVDSAAAIAGEAAVRDAIRSSLASWALSSERTS